jgi:hypothetical protein
VLEGRGSCCIEEEEEAEVLLVPRLEEARALEAFPLPLTSMLLALGMLMLGPCSCVGVAVVADAAAVAAAVVGEVVAIVAVLLLLLLLLLEEAPAWMSAKAVSGTWVMGVWAVARVLLAVPVVAAGDMRLLNGVEGE